MKYIFISILACVVFTFSCSDKKIVQKPIDALVKDNKLMKEPTFTILLQDMEIKNKGFHKEYLHKYNIVKNKDGKPLSTKSKWYHVKSSFFWRHENNLGMEIANKDSIGKFRKVVSPPGYSNYVGNSRYGYWNQSSGRPVWTFFAQYMMMRSLLNLTPGRIYRSNYSNYRTNYYNRGYAYYGGRTNSGSRRYGTYSSSRRSSSSSSSSYGRRWGRGGGGYGK